MELCPVSTRVVLYACLSYVPCRFTVTDYQSGKVVLGFTSDGDLVTASRILAKFNIEYSVIEAEIYVEFDNH